MKTRSGDHGPGTGLPPPPAPTARDANPWTMSDGASVGGRRPAAVPPRTPVPRSQSPQAATSTSVRPPPGPPATTTVPPSRPRRFPVQPVDPARRRRLPFVPFVVLSFFLLTSIGLLFRAVESGRPEEAAGPLLMAGFAAVMLWRMLQRRGP
jgi:hypothetical protein